MGSFDAKKPPSKISCLGTFKLTNGESTGHSVREQERKWEICSSTSRRAAAYGEYKSLFWSTSEACGEDIRMGSP
jgi:hypothetical protein